MQTKQNRVALCVSYFQIKIDPLQAIKNISFELKIWISRKIETYDLEQT